MVLCTIYVLLLLACSTYMLHVCVGVLFSLPSFLIRSCLDGRGERGRQSRRRKPQNSVCSSVASSNTQKRFQYIGCGVGLTFKGRGGLFSSTEISISSLTAFSLPFSVVTSVNKRPRSSLFSSPTDVGGGCTGERERMKEHTCVLTKA